jgi:hypothetical protein
MSVMPPRAIIFAVCGYGHTPGSKSSRDMTCETLVIKKLVREEQNCDSSDGCVPILHHPRQLTRCGASTKHVANCCTLYAQAYRHKSLTIAHSRIYQTE